MRLRDGRNEGFAVDFRERRAANNRTAISGTRRAGDEENYVFVVAGSSHGREYAAQGLDSETVLGPHRILRYVGVTRG